MEELSVSFMSVLWMSRIYLSVILLCSGCWFTTALLLPPFPDSSQKDVSQQQIRDTSTSQRNIKMAPRSPDGVDFWKPPGSGSLFAKLHESSEQQSAAPPGLFKLLDNSNPVRFSYR